ncbi:MAG: hypothetical protein GXN92_02785 [Candidatus Micrarchaeota archaeon]|nr:hypothetical protein [Candidatus Micrarchaeota archaeon]
MEMDERQVEIRVGGIIDREMLFGHWFISMGTSAAISLMAGNLFPLLSLSGGVLAGMATLVFAKDWLRADPESYNLPALTLKGVEFVPLPSEYESYIEYGIRVGGKMVARLPFALGKNIFLVLTVQGVDKEAHTGKWKRALRPFFKKLEAEGLQVNMANPVYNHFYTTHPNKSSLPRSIYRNLFQGPKEYLCLTPFKVAPRGRYTLVGKVLGKGRVCAYSLESRRLTAAH